MRTQPSVSESKDPGSSEEKSLPADGTAEGCGGVPTDLPFQRSAQGAEETAKSPPLNNTSWPDRTFTEETMAELLSDGGEVKPGGTGAATVCQLVQAAVARPALPAAARLVAAPAVAEVQASVTAAMATIVAIGRCFVQESGVRRVFGQESDLVRARMISPPR
jgi:hypothetical protein